MSEEAEVPQAELLTEDGKVIALRMERFPDLDRPAGHPAGEIRYYLAYPEQQVDLQTCVVHAIRRPPHTGFRVEVPQGGLETIQPDA